MTFCRRSSIVKNDCCDVINVVCCSSAAFGKIAEDCLFQALGQWGERSEKEQASSSAAFKKTCCDLSTLHCCSSATFEKICCDIDVV